MFIELVTILQLSRLHIVLHIVYSGNFLQQCSQLLSLLLQYGNLLSSDADFDIFAFGAARGPQNRELADAGNFQHAFTDVIDDLVGWPLAASFTVELETDKR